MTCKNYTQCTQCTVHNQYVGHTHTHAHMYTYICILLTGLSFTWKWTKESGTAKKVRAWARVMIRLVYLCYPIMTSMNHVLAAVPLTTVGCSWLCVHCICIAHTYSSSRIFTNKEHCRRMWQYLFLEKNWDYVQIRFPQRAIFKSKLYIFTLQCIYRTGVLLFSLVAASCVLHL